MWRISSLYLITFYSFMLYCSVHGFLPQYLSYSKWKIHYKKPSFLYLHCKDLYSGLYSYFSQWNMVFQYHIILVSVNC